MFKKPLAHQSNATPLRSSARRQLLERIFAQYPDLKHGLPDSKGPDGEGLGVKELGKLILPEGIKVSTFGTSGGIEGTLYSADGDPLWMSFGRNSEELIPTLSLLALQLPTPPIPILKLHHPVPPPLFTGAPLFLPAVRNLHEPWRIPDVPENGIVAFVSSPTGDDVVEYVGVGRVVARGGVRDAVERRIRHRRERRDVDEGRFCDVLCIHGDQCVPPLEVGGVGAESSLWEMGSKPPPAKFTMALPLRPLAPPPSMSGTTAPAAQQDEESQPESNEPPTEAMRNVTVEGALESLDGDYQINPKEICTLLDLALYQALTTLDPSVFPIPASQLYSAYVLPSRPSYIPVSRREDVVIGKSNWKKLAKWMKELNKDGVLKTKESKGEVIVTGFNPDHPALDSHVPFITIAEQEAKDAKKAARDAAPEEGAGGPSGTSKGKGHKILVEELWKPSGVGVDFWEACGVDKGAVYPPPLLKSAAEEYFSKHNLVDLQDRRLIILDETLGRAVGVKQPTPGQSMTREQILAKLRAGVAWWTSVDGVLKGTLDPIVLAVKTRNGRRTITSIVNLESFGIDLEDLAAELKRACAGSATLQPLTGASPKLNLQELIVQGSQVKIVTEALVARDVPRKWIKEGEGDKKRK